MITCPFCFSCFTSIKTSSDVARVSFGRPISAGDRDVVVVGGGGGLEQGENLVETPKIQHFKIIYF